MPQIQTLIHKLEVGGGMRFLKYWLVALALLGLLVSYNMRGYKNMSTQEAMDTAQLARNIAEHKGYTTLFVRPFSMYLVEKAYTDSHGPVSVGDTNDIAQVYSMHPDLANPPVYPLLLAGMMKLNSGLRYQTAGESSIKFRNKPLNIWNRNGSFSIYPPDFFISLFNQFLFFGLVVMVFFIARRLFDNSVAWTSAVLFIGTDLFWRFSMSGLSTILLMLIFLTLGWCLTLLEQKSRETPVNTNRMNLLAIAIGALAGLGCLTRYSFGWLILPVIAFFILFLGRQRVVLSLIALVTFSVVVGPWVARNYHISHTLFGTAGYAAYETTYHFPGNHLERSIAPNLTAVSYRDFWNKLITNTRTILQEDLPRLGGNWMGAFFLVGLLINFRNPTLSRLRYFLLMCLPVLVVTQALGRTHLTEDSPVINSENLLVLVAPLVIIFGVSLFFILLDQLNLPLLQLRYLVTGAFCFLVCLPTILSFVSPATNPIAYPPYHPQLIQLTSRWMKENELVMSDVPWAVAWYGKRQSVWTTLNVKDDFYNVYDYKKTVHALYLTQITTDSKFLSDCVPSSGEWTWGGFVAVKRMRNELPPQFPLNRSAPLVPGQLFLSDMDRWSTPAAVAADNTVANTNTPPFK